MSCSVWESVMRMLQGKKLGKAKSLAWSQLAASMSYLIQNALLPMSGS